MHPQVIKVITELQFDKKLDDFIQKQEVIETWKHISKKTNRLYLSILAHPHNIQKILDRLESICGRTSDTHIFLLPITAILSLKVKKLEEKEEKKAISKSIAISREELYNQVSSGTKLDINFISLIILSTIVAAIGLLENNIAVVIGAMVIAPMLGPNLALSLATTLGDYKLMSRAIRSNLAGIIICVILSIFIGLIWPYGFGSFQLLLRTDVTYDSLVLALTSGAAAVLSITAGLSSALVGVMVAAALLPPAATFGIMLGADHLHSAAGAGLLLAVNIVCINLVANITFVLKGIRPNRWYEKQKAKKALRWNLLFWTITLLIIAIAIYLRHGLTFIIKTIGLDILVK